MRASANVFVEKSGRSALIVALHQNECGIWYEDESPGVLTGVLSAELLGEAAQDALARSSRRDKDLRACKPTDWPAYRASRARSVRLFEESFVRIELKAANDANLVAVVVGWPEKDAPLQITGSVSMQAGPAKLGTLVLGVFEACRDRRV